MISVTATVRQETKYGGFQKYNSIEEVINVSLCDISRKYFAVAQN